MLLTISQATQPNLERSGGILKSTHDFPSKADLFKFRASPLSKVSHPVTTPPRDISLEEKPNIADMATPHRGLPPPSAMQLPEPGRPPPAAQYTLPGAMPAPPSHWQGHEESMRNWLHAKAEEDRRKAEEEKTRQETLRLEQRKIEHNMLRESLQAGIPPQMIPLIYAGIGGGDLVQLSAEWLHQYATQLQLSQQQQLQTPEVRSQRMIGEVAYAVAPAPAPAVPVAVPGYQAEAAPAAPPYSAYPRTGPTSAPRSLAQAALPRLTTNDVFVPQSGPSSAHPLQQSQTLSQDGPSSSPSIYFHHWVPPGGDASKHPQTPATKRADEPSSAHPGSHLSDGESRDSPRKRKAQGGHQANPPPTTAAQYGSPSFSTTSSASTKRMSGHSRNRSTASFKEESRPESRREEHRFSFVPPIVREEIEVERRPERVADRREDSATAGASAKARASQRTSPRASLEEQRPRSRADELPPQTGSEPPSDIT